MKTFWLPRTGWKRSLISAFIVFNVVAINSGTSKPLSQQNALQKFFTPYLRWTRLLQHWDLFVPAPRKYALAYRAEIIFKDGSTKIWRRPYPPNWSFFERHLSYNFQKWDLASNYLQIPGLLWPDLAAYLQRIYWNDANPPETIKFISSRATWPPPHETGYIGHDDSELKWEDHVLFTYLVNEKRFK